MHGKEVLSLQHDGIIVDRRGGTHGREAAAELGRYVETAAGYPVRVKHEELVVEDDTNDESGTYPRCRDRSVEIRGGNHLEIALYMIRPRLYTLVST
eukprot:399451-Prymnesium_polylepis.1